MYCPHNFPIMHVSGDHISWSKRLREQKGGWDCSQCSMMHPTILWLQVSMSLYHRSKQLLTSLGKSQRMGTMCKGKMIRCNRWSRKNGMDCARLVMSQGGLLPMTEGKARSLISSSREMQMLSSENLERQLSPNAISKRDYCGMKIVVVVTAGRGREDSACWV